MDARRLLWILVVASGATMVVALILQRTAKVPEQAGKAQPRPASRPATDRASQQSQPSPASRPAAGASWRWEVHPAKEATLGSTDPASGYRLELSLSSLGAAVKGLKLARGGQLLRAVTFAGRSYYPLATRHILFPDEGRGQNLTVLHWRAGEVRRAPDGTQSLTFTLAVKRNGQDYVRLEKTYSLAKGSNFVQVSLRAVNLAAREVTVKLTQFGTTGLAAAASGPEQRELIYGRLVGGNLQLRRIPLAATRDMALGLRHCRWLGRSDAAEPVLWLGLADRDNTALTCIIPGGRLGPLAGPSAPARFFAAAIQESARRRTFLAGMNLGPSRIGPAGALTVRMKLYAGPRQPDPFEADPAYKARKAGRGTGWQAEAGPRGEVLLGSLDQRSGYKFQVQLTTLGAAIRTLKLSEHFRTVADKKYYRRSPDTYRRTVQKAYRRRRLRRLRQQYPELEGLVAKYPQLRAMGPKLLQPASAAKLPEEFRKLLETRPGLRKALKDCPELLQKDPGKVPDLWGNYSLLNPVPHERQDLYAMATREVRFPEASHGQDLARLDWRAGPVKTDGNSQQVTFTTQLSRYGKPCLRLEKTYAVTKGSYSVKVTLRAVNLGSEELQFELTHLLAAGVPREGIQRDQRSTAYGKLVKGELKVMKRPVPQANGKKAPPDLASPDELGRSDAGPEAVLWAGSSNRFFAAFAYIFPHQGSEALAAPAAKAAFLNAAVPESPTWRTYVPLMKLGPHRLEPGKALELKLDLFAGPKKRALFNGNALYRALNYKGALEFRPCFCAPPALALVMMWLLDLFSKVTLGNYGLAIVLLVVLVRLCLHPLTKKGQVAMMAMQKLQPELEKIREKYKDDKDRLQQETMKVYRSAGITPMLGCLPMFLQMPIWIALWTGLQAAVELRHAPFLPVWITDLSVPDALIRWAEPSQAATWPMVGPMYAFNLLPVLLAVAMFLQQKYTPTAAAASQPQKQASQKQMAYFMTGFFLLIFYNAPSGLTMYIMASTFAGVAEQYFIRKHIRQMETVEAATETKVAIPGKRFRGQKPKKPKGPFRLTK
ncbi:MAG: hypothetical protein B1H04_00290 [Planctomycetales bacterium 4484_123]|nr:MAG: hypothetical protein B1H04_00290 [Planctomycetales bacterium 4484_123]